MKDVCLVFLPPPSFHLPQLRALVVKMILATDNAVHGAVLSGYAERLEQHATNPLDFHGNEKDVQTVFSVALHVADVSNVRVTRVLEGGVFV